MFSFENIAWQQWYIFCLFVTPLVSAGCDRDSKVVHEDITYTVVTNCKKKYSKANEDCKSQATAGKKGQLAILDTQSKINALDAPESSESFWYVPSKGRQDYIFYFRKIKTYILSISICICRIAGATIYGLVSQIETRKVLSSGLMAHLWVRFYTSEQEGAWFWVNVPKSTSHCKTKFYIE